MNLTMAKPILTPDEAALLIRDGVTVAIGGSGAGHSIPERMLEAIGRRHHASGEPRELTLIHPFGVGDQGARGLEHMAMAGLYHRVIGGHWSMSSSMAKLAAESLFEAYCLPAGIREVRQITFSGANAIATGQEVLYVTEAAVFRLTAEGLQLEEVAPGLDAERDVAAKMAFRPLLGASPGTMREELFAPALLPADCFPAFQ